jgi:ubiquinone/menaquinone biosynthesis C-methylase UbiE
MQKEVPEKRWELAQKAEKSLWESIPKNFIEEHSKYYIKKAEYLKNILIKYKKIDSRTKFLQIGCACADIINYLDIGEKYSIDPLADFYKSHFKLDYKKSRLISGMGEKLPYADNNFDVIILANVLDHTQNPKKVLSEVNRVLKRDGLLYFENHFYQKGFLILSKFYSQVKRLFFGQLFNPCHPHMFLLKELREIISGDFEMIFEEEIGKDIENEVNNTEELKKLLMKEKLSRKIPAFFGLFGTINFTCLCSKKVKNGV